MSHLIGRGRYRGETYPGAGGGGGGGSSSVPLSRQRFIDGDTVQTGLNGSANQPFKTIAQFIASRGNASATDAAANYVGWVMPALAGYVEDVVFPAYASTELRADSLSIIDGSLVTGNVTWPNTAGAHAATGGAVSGMHNVTVSGSITVTDDSGAPASAFVFGGDEIGNGSVSLGGGFSSPATTKLATVSFENASIAGGINAGSATTSATVNLLHSFCSGNISCRSLAADDSTLNSSTITVFDTAAFSSCRFSAAAALTPASGTATFTFDGPSWASFLEANGTRATGAIVLVVGGSSASMVEGAALTGASTNVSLNGTGATAGFTNEHSGNHYTTSNGTPTTVTLKTGGGEQVGDTMLITKTDTGANAVAVKNNAGTTIGTIPANNRGFVLARYNGSDWVLVAGGALAA